MAQWLKNSLPYWSSNFLKDFRLRFPRQLTTNCSRWHVVRSVTWRHQQRTASNDPRTGPHCSIVRYTTVKLVLRETNTVAKLYTATGRARGRLYASERRHSVLHETEASRRRETNTAVWKIARDWISCSIRVLAKGRPPTKLQWRMDTLPQQNDRFHFIRSLQCCYMYRSQRLKIKKKKNFEQLVFALEQSWTAQQTRRCAFAADNESREVKSCDLRFARR